jgi:hypothetical protein
MRPIEQGQRVVVAAAIGLLAAGVGCTIVTPPGDGGTRIIPFRPDGPPAPKPLQASVLYVVNLQRSSTNLSQSYANIITGFGGYLEGVGLSVERLGVISTYADQYGSRLLLGRRKDSPTPSPTLLAAAAAASDGGGQNYEQLLPYLAGAFGNISDADLPLALSLLAASGDFDGTAGSSEAANVIGLGQGLGADALPTALGGIDRRALFDRPGDLFIVVYVQPLGRRCAFSSGDCNVAGRTPADIFLETDSSGGVAWLKFSDGTLRPQQVVQVSVSTSEGEDLTTFRRRCTKDGVPSVNFDVIAPSANLYFTPLMAALNGAQPGTGHLADFCDITGADPGPAIKKLGDSVAAVAVSH